MEKTMEFNAIKDADMLEMVRILRGPRNHSRVFTELFQGVHGTVPGCPWNFQVFHLNLLGFPWKVSDYPKVSLESCPNTLGIFRGFRNFGNNYGKGSNGS